MPQNTATQYSKELQRSCGNRISFDNYPIVCCTEIHAGIPNNNNNNPRQNPDRDTFTLPSSTTEKIDEAKILSHTTPRSEGSDNVCQGPTGDIGFCISIHNCTNLLDRIRATPNDENLKSELRSSNTICGSKDMNVCCPVTNSKSRAVNTGETPRRLPTEDEGCGFVRQATGKIVGGRESEIGDWPWIALIGYNAYSLNPFRCGGSLVTAKHVITAAHCITRDLSFVRLGEHDLSTQSETKHLDVDVDKVVGHPNFTRNDFRFDIAVLLLVKNVDFTDLIQAICLPISNTLRNKSYVKSNPFVAGWGRTMERGSSSNVLKELQLPVQDNSVCLNTYKRLNYLRSNQQFDDSVICAGNLVGGEDTCQGDSGGPLMMPEPYKGVTRYYLIGIVSYGIGCGRIGIPAVYTSTQHYMDWITDQIASM
ncbi:venom protease-like [Teleopsis dalmanni]|uniref:venom protease-like n=1 Tax=Teleopsis dalmanni TaxID=139649 RepID=UPI0018CFA5A2|nr:venom protease-like [Teleopsis dalmanni]